MRTRLAPIALACLSSVLAFAADPSSPPKAPASPAAIAKAPAPAAPAATAAKTGTITGRVTGADAKPLAGAVVRAVATAKPVAMSSIAGRRRAARAEAAKIATATTAADGTFKLDALPNDSYTVRVDAKGVAPVLAEKVPLGATLNLKMKPGLPVTGKVLDLSTQKPVAGATVRALEHNAEAFGLDAARQTTTAEDGTFAIADCPPGAVTLDAIAPGRAHARLEDVVVKKRAEDEAPKPDANTLFLRPGGRLAGRVVGSDGKPLAYASVSATAGDGAILTMLRDAPRPQRTDASGRFDFDGLPAGNRWTLRARKPGLADGEAAPIALEAGTDRSDLEIKLESGATLTFRLATADDVGVTDAELALRPAAAPGGGGERSRSFRSMAPNNVATEQITTKSDGTFTVKNLEAGTFDVTVSPAEYADVAKEAVRLKAGETADLGTLRVKEAKSIAGRITDQSGQPVAGATIAAIWLDGMTPHPREAKSKSDGRYKLSGFGDQPVRDVWVNAEGFATSRKEGVMPGDTAADFVLDKLGSVTGKVLLPDGSVPPAFRVSAHPEAKEGQERFGFRMIVGMGSSDADKLFVDPAGNFRLDGVAPGKVTIEARADGVAPGRKSGLDVQSDQTADAGTITLAAGRSLHGRVLASKDDAPIPGATITLTQPGTFMVRMGADPPDGAAISRVDGTFQIDGLEPRSYNVNTNQPDYSPATGRVEVTADQDVDDFVVRLSKGGTLTGLVRDAQKQPLPGVQVLVAKMPMSGGPQTTTTGSDGRYTLDKLPPGDYIVMKAPAPGQPMMLSSGMKQASVAEGITTEFDLDDASKINLSGRVLRAGQPVPGATILLSADGSAGGPSVDVKTAQADDAGRYQVGLDTAGRYDATVSAGGMSFDRGRAITIDVPDQPAPVVDITLKSSGISGRVTDADGKAVGSASVTAVAIEGDKSAQPFRAHSEVDGTYRMENVDPGTYKLTAAASGFRNAELASVTVAADIETPGIDIRLDSALSVKGHVLDVNGRGIAGAMVVVAGTGTASSGRDTAPATTDINGAFVVTAPVDGPLDFTAIAGGYAPARATGVVPADDQDVTLRAPRGGRIRVTVTGANGQPVPGVSVYCNAVPDFLGSGMLSFVNRPTPTGADGSTMAGPLAAGTYSCAARSGSKSISKPASVDDGGESAISIALP